tara:strand:- start:966 stop:2399 length:1434 start_codon:yes stop_codon:yes gene_type:complete
MDKKHKNCYKIPCIPLQTVLLVRKFNLKEENALYKEIKDKIGSTDRPINIESYMEIIIKRFLIDADEVLNHLESMKGWDTDKIEILRAVYDCVIKLYPPFMLEAVCEDLNQFVFMNRRTENAVNQQINHFLKAAAVGFAVEQMEEEEPAESSPEPELITKEDIENIRDFLFESLIGQRTAISAVIDALKLLATGLAGHSSFFFIGPTGVGKTQLSRLLGQKYSGNFYKINCAEYSGGHEYSKLIGSPPGYIGHSEHSVLGEKAAISNRWVFVFDEIEKANEKFYDFLLSLLDDGTITDNMGNELDFTESIFVFTSNQGLKEGKVGEETLGFGGKVISYDESEDEILKSVKKLFNPEFLNRIDNFIFFNTLSEKDIEEIVKLELKNVPVKATKALVAYIVENAYSNEYGARNVKRFIKNYVAVKIADAILEKRVPTITGSLYTPRITLGELSIVNTKDFEESNYGKDGVETAETDESG